MIILNESKIKYGKLDELLQDQLHDLRFSSNVNILVDLKEIYKKFFRPDIMTEFDSVQSVKEEILSDIINIIGHYRNYFYKRNKYTNFVFFYSTKKCDEILKTNPDYKKTYYDKYFEGHDDNEKKKISLFKEITKFLDIFINAVPHCRFFDTYKSDEFAYMKAYIANIPNNELTLILSNDDILFQLISNNVFVLDIKGIRSSLLRKDNVVSILSKRETSLTSNMIPLIVAIGGNDKYSISGLPRVALNRATQIVDYLVNKDIAHDENSVSVPIDFTKLDTNVKLEKKVFDNRDLITKNYFAIRSDTIYYKNKMLMDSEFATVTVNRSRRELEETNAKMFTRFPLQIDMLLRGEKGE